MAFPSVELAQSVLYYSRGYDKLNDGVYAAIITGVHTVEETIDLTVLPPGADPVPITGIKYGDDVAINNPFFILTTDSPPSCLDEPTALTIVDDDAANFVVQWSRPIGSGGALVFYRVSGGPGTWYTPNDPGNKSGTINEDMIEFIFTDLTPGVSYDILIQNICSNGEVSSGNTVTGTATTPP